MAFPTRKTPALLAYLATEGGLHSRERLTALLWPESDEEHGRGALRSTLNLLRKALREMAADGGADCIAVAGDRLGFVATAEAPVDLDLQALEAASALARDASRLAPAELVARLQVAADRYRGDFLAGFSLSDAPDFDHWVTQQRETWRRRADLVFDRLSLTLADGGELVGAIETTARWVAMDSLIESAHRRLMQVRFAAGDRAAALRAFESCRAILAAELNAAPAPETEALADRIRTQAPPPSEPPPREPVIPLVTVEAPLVGRLTEHAQLAAAFRAARRGRPQAVGIEGEAGIGKTRLATEFLRWVAAQGAVALQGRALETRTRLPYQPVIEVLRGPLATVADVRRLLGDVWLAELGRLLPEVRDRYPDLPDPPSMGEAEARTRLFEAVARFGQRLAEQAPLVLFIDDIQWADAASLDVIHYAGRRWAATSAPVLLVFALRAEESSATSGLADWRAGVGRDLPLARVQLGPLTAEDTLRLAREMDNHGPGSRDREGSGSDRPPPLGDPDADRFGRWLFAETGGHPFFIAETVKALFERGLLRPAAVGGWTVAAEATADGGASPARFVAPGVRAVIRGRLDRLSPAARAGLTVAATLGDGFDFEGLRRVAGLNETDGLAALDELLARRLLRESGDRYRFGHDKIREVAYAEASEARRRLYHRRALASLEPSNPPAAELARHALGAGLGQQAFRYSVMAGDEAMRVFAARDAIAPYEQARELARSLSSPVDPPTTGELHHLLARLGRAYELTAQLEAARAVYQELLDLARTAGEPAIECAALNHLATVAAHGPLDFDAQAALLESALAIAERSGDLPGLVETEWNLSRLGLFRFDLAAARAHGWRVLVLAREHELAEPLARMLNWLAIVEHMRGGWAEAEAHATEAQAIYAGLGNRPLEADSLVQLAAAQIRSGQLGAGLGAARAAWEISQEIDNPWGRADAAKELALGLLDGGRYQEALAVAEAGVAAARAIAYPPLLVLTLAVLGAVHRQRGTLKQARAVHDEAWAVQAVMGWPVFAELVAAEACADCGVAGDWDQAYQHACRAIAARSDETGYVGLTRWYETEALVRAGDVDRAVADVRRFDERAGANRRYRIPYLRAQAALAGGRTDTTAAIRHLDEARRLAAAIGLPGELWQIQAAIGELRASRGERASARRAFAEAAAIVRSLADGLADEPARATFLAAEPVRRVLLGRG